MVIPIPAWALMGFELIASDELDASTTESTTLMEMPNLCPYFLKELTGKRLVSAIRVKHPNCVLKNLAPSLDRFSCDRFLLQFFGTYHALFSASAANAMDEKLNTVGFYQQTLALFRVLQPKVRFDCFLPQSAALMRSRKKN